MTALEPSIRDWRHTEISEFAFDGQMLRGLEQNPKIASRWARLAREGKKVTQFLSGGRYIAVIIDICGGHV